jgi:hypothetical protein
VCFPLPFDSNFLHPGWVKYSFSVVFGFSGVKMTCNGEKKKKKEEKKEGLQQKVNCNGC